MKDSELLSLKTKPHFLLSAQFSQELCLGRSSLEEFLDEGFLLALLQTEGPSQTGLRSIAPAHFPEVDNRCAIARRP